MRAGQLRHKVDLLRPTDSTDTFGQATQTYDRVATVAASINPLTGRELFLAQQIRADLTHEIKIRGRTDVSAKWRVVWAGRIFELGPPLSPNEQGTEQGFTAVEKRL